jgi:hypothetical protein
MKSPSSSTIGWSGFNGVDMNRSQFISTTIAWSLVLFVIMWSLQQNAVADALLHTYQIEAILIGLNTAATAFLFGWHYCTRSDVVLQHDTIQRPRMIVGSPATVRDLFIIYLRSISFFLPFSDSSHRSSNDMTWGA